MPKFKILLMLASSKQKFDKKTNKTYMEESEFSESFTITASNLEAAGHHVSQYIVSIAKERKANIIALKKTIKEIK